MATQTWDLWISDAASRGISFGRGVLAPADLVLVHSAPELLRVGEGRVTREDAWPAAEDHGRLVILPGGEVGRLLEWWNAPDHSEWRWSVEFHNRR